MSECSPSKGVQNHRLPRRSKVSSSHVLPDGDSSGVSPAPTPAQPTCQFQYFPKLWLLLLFPAAEVESYQKATSSSVSFNKAMRNNFLQRRLPVRNVCNEQPWASCSWAQSSTTRELLPHCRPSSNIPEGSTTDACAAQRLWDGSHLFRSIIHPPQ